MVKSKDKRTKLKEDIKNMYGAWLKLSIQEIERIISVAEETGLSIILREIEPYRDDNGNLLIFIKRDGYRKAAQRDPEYEYHEVYAYCKNDIVEIKEGKLNFSPNLIERGEVMGAICVVKRKSAWKEMITLVDFKEYFPKNDGSKITWLREKLWQEKWMVMIEKVAEATGLRRGFSNMFNWTYHEAELDKLISTKDIKMPDKEEIENAFERKLAQKKWIREENIEEEKDEIKSLQDTKDEMEAKILWISLEEYRKKKTKEEDTKNKDKWDIFTQSMFDEIEWE